MNNLRRRRRQGGFTLIEIMVVVVILGILAGVVVPRLMEGPDKARQARAKQDISTLASSLELYRLDNFYYPTTQQGLDALQARPAGDPPAKNWQEGGYAKVAKDPWNNPYQYLQPGTKGDYDLFSYGRDGKPGGEGYDADIGNWEETGS